MIRGGVAGGGIGWLGRGGKKREWGGRCEVDKARNLFLENCDARD